MGHHAHPGTIFGIEIQGGWTISDEEITDDYQRLLDFLSLEEDPGIENLILQIKCNLYGEDETLWPPIYGIKTDFEYEEYGYFLSNHEDVLRFSKQTNMDKSLASVDPTWKNILHKFLDDVGGLDHLKDLEPEIHDTPDMN